MQFWKLAKPRGFEYIPRFYDPDKEENGKAHIKFRRIRRSELTPKSSPLRLLIMALVLLFAVLYLSRHAKIEKDAEARKIIVEEIVIVE